MDAAKSLGLFLRASPTPYQMVETASNMLVRAGFKRLPEDDVWKLQGQAAAPGKYFYIRAASTIVAFAVSAAMEKGSGYKIVGAHTDSPVLKVKPVSKKNASGYMQLGVECYGEDCCVGIGHLTPPVCRRWTLAYLARQGVVLGRVCDCGGEWSVQEEACPHEEACPPHSQFVHSSADSR